MPSLSDARALNRADPLRTFRDRFQLPADVIYLDGNSLGPLPAATPARLAGIAEGEWGDRLVASWNEAGWWQAPARIGDKIARLIGASEGEVIATDTTSVNLFKLVAATLEGRAGAILAERDNFPSDAHVGEEVARVTGRPFRMVPGADLLAALGEDVAVAIVTHVNYRSAARIDMAALERRAREVGALIVWDLSHSTGAVPLALGVDGVRLAVGCGYKYLNGGPGAPAFLYVRRDLQDRLRSPIAGWWSHEAPFAFGSHYRPAPGIARFLAGTQPMLSLLALEVGVDLMLEADPPAVWKKSRALFDLFVDRVEERCPDLELLSPRDAERRGSHVSFAHPEAHGIIRALIQRGVIGDYRAPDVARFGLTPLTLSFEEAWQAAEALAAVVAERAWDALPPADGLVT